MVGRFARRARLVAPIARRHIDLASEDGIDASLLGLIVEGHGGKHVAVFRDRHSRHLEFSGAVEHLADAAGAVQERELRVQVQMDELSHPYSHSIVAGGFELMSYTTRLMPLTSLTMREDIDASRSCGNRAQSAVMPSRLSTARMATVYSYVRASPITPTLCTGSSTAKLCQSRSYQPARRISSATILSASRRRSSRSRVIGPSRRTARPGPGNGCRTTNSLSSPRSRPTRRTSSLNRSRSGSTSLKCIRSGRPPTLWWLLITTAGPCTDADSITSG